MSTTGNNPSDTEIRDLKVLIIEDDAFVSMVYEDHLEAADQARFTTESHTELSAGLEALEKGNFDILLLDLNLPDSDYSNTISKIPSIAYDVPIIIMTSTNDEKLALKTMNMGAQDYLNKDRLDKVLFIRSILYSVERHQLKCDLRKEKQKSDKLLHNILPSSVIREIQENGKAQAKEFENVSILFTDFVGFTQISADLTPSQLVEELDACFRAFDAIVERYNLEKIKTIGDAYMAVGGLTSKDGETAELVVMAAIEMQNYMKDRAIARKAKHLPAFQMRVGIHSGSVVAGIVGTLKFQYDIWGDAVNTASRMESNAEVGEVNISKSTYILIKDSLAFQLESRGVADVKGKGTMEMWRVSLKNQQDLPS
ncbi:MAG: adenylate/guanylate cyclase domain-containing response regulator [Bacteroidota bacterium]